MSSPPSIAVPLSFRWPVSPQWRCALSAKVHTGTPTETLERQANLVSTLNSSIALGRRIIEDLRPSTLSNLGLVPTLEILAIEFTGRSGIVVACALTPVALEAKNERVVCRMVQEAATNITKYAQAGRGLTGWRSGPRGRQRLVGAVLPAGADRSDDTAPTRPIAAASERRHTGLTAVPSCAQGLRRPEATAPHHQASSMLHYAVVFFIIALVAALFGFGCIAASAVGIGKVLFLVIAVLATRQESPCS